MSLTEKMDYPIKTLATAGATHLANACLAATKVGELLGRAIIQMPIRAAYVPAASAVAITVISDIFENYVVNKCFDTFVKHDGGFPIYKTDSPNFKKLTNFLVRVLAGTALFAAGTAVTGGTLLPAMMGGAVMGALVYVANKVAKVSVDILKCSLVTVVLIIRHCTNLLSNHIERVENFKTNVYESLSPETLTLQKMVACFLCKNK